MKKFLTLFLAIFVTTMSSVLGAETDPPAEKPADSALVETTRSAEKTVRGALEKADEKISELGERQDVQEAADKVIDWIDAVSIIYQPWMNWFLVATGVALFVSHSGQLLIGKFYLAIRWGTWNWKEFLNDLLVTVFAALALPAVLVIPVGHGAFIANPINVLSSVGVGMVFGILLYGHGLRLEADAAKEQKEAKEKTKGAD